MPGMLLAMPAGLLGRTASHRLLVVIGLLAVMSSGMLAAASGSLETLAAQHAWSAAPPSSARRTGREWGLTLIAAFIWAALNAASVVYRSFAPRVLTDGAWGRWRPPRSSASRVG